MKLTKIAQKTLDWINEGNHPNDYEDASAEIKDFIEKISCGDGFWYGITDGGYIDISLIVETNDVESLTKKELEVVQTYWEQLSIEF